MCKFTVVLVLLLVTACLGLESDVEMEEVMPEFADEGFSQAAIIPTDSEEVSQLKEKHIIFSDFCIRSRDMVIGDIKRTTNELSSNIFILFFKSAEDVGLEVMSDVKAFATKMTQDLKVAPKAEEIISAEQKAILESPDKPKSIFDAVSKTIAHFGNSMSTKIVKRLDAVKSAFGLGEVANALIKSCGKINEYNENLVKLFEETRNEITQLDKALGEAKLETVDCVTSKRLMKIYGLCKIVRVAQNPLIKMLLNINNPP